VKQPLVTIVTPSYNQGQFIRETIESVLTQDYARIEYLILDGGSTDETATVVAEYAGRLQFISERDRGQSHAINKGWRMAQGEIVTWVNSDDILLPGAVRHAVAAFERSPALGGVYGDGYLIDREGAVVLEIPAREPTNLWKLIYVGDYILQHTAYFRRTAIEEIGYLDEGLHWSMDWDLLIRLAQRYPMEYIPEWMGSWRMYDEAKSFSGGHRRFRELAALMRRHGKRRYPPAYFYYGLETYGKLLCERIQQLTPDWLQPPSVKLQGLITRLAERQMVRIWNHAQGLYSDGWVGPRLKYLVPRGSEEICITGCLPAIMPWLRRQRLTVRCDGTVVRRVRIEPGEFEVRVPAPNGTAPVLIEIEATRWVVPARVGIGPDPRRLAFQLKGIS
jgi:glycosyltransferase involved in cell wall biosynthesis